MKAPNLQFITKFLRRHHFKQVRKKLEKSLDFWQHELGYFYHLNLYTLKVISHLFSHKEPRTRFNYSLPFYEADDFMDGDEFNDWSD